VLGAASLKQKSNANLIMGAGVADDPAGGQIAFFFGAFGSRIPWRRRPDDDPTWAAAFRPDDR
jgi:hypothetical protein